jgi:GT2 family glycosyltransferase
MDEHPEAGLCGVKLVHPDGSFQASYADFPTLKSEFFIATGLGTRFISPYYPSPRPQPGTGACEIDWVAGAFMLVRREVLAQVGDMDEAYYMYSEETDWCYRIKRAGWKIYYLPDVAITHIGGASTRQRSAEMVAQLNKSKIRFFAKHYGRWRAAQLRLALWLIFAVREGSIYCLLVVQPSANRNRWRAELREARLIRKVCLQPL